MFADFKEHKNGYDPFLRSLGRISCGEIFQVVSLDSETRRVCCSTAYRNSEFTQNFATTCAPGVPCNVPLNLRKYDFLALALIRKSSVAATSRQPW